MVSLSLKPGVSLRGVRPEILFAMQVAHAVFTDLRDSFDKYMVVTSVVDGKHGHGSLHYTGCAFDLRTRHLKPHEVEGVAKALREALGEDFDVVVEPTHIHVEFQPKDPVRV